MPEWLGQGVVWLRSGWGDVLGALASLIAVFGVPSAVWTARQARTAAEAAEDAARSIQRRLAAFDAVVTISGAMERLQALKALHRDERWDFALDRYSTLRRELIAIRERDTTLKQQEQAIVQSAILLLDRLESHVENARQKSMPMNAAAMNRSVSAAIDELQSMLQRRQSVSTEDIHGG